MATRTPKNLEIPTVGGGRVLKAIPRGLVSDDIVKHLNWCKHIFVPFIERLILQQND